MSLNDIYFEKDYGRLYEDIENGICEVFEFQHPLGSVRHLYIKCEIEAKLDGQSYYELKTPYGYGGPMLSDCLDQDKIQVVEAFEAAFRKHCQENRIVQEFVRFHPVFSNAQDFSGCYDVAFKRKTTGTNLVVYEDPVMAEYSKSCRRNIRKALKEGVTFKITVHPDGLKNFQDIYYSTMERNKADAIYYFDEQYFNNCLRLVGENMILTEVFFEEKVIGMGISFVYDHVINTHLSGTLEEYHHLSPAYVLQYALALWGKDNGISLIHDGGGRTSEPDDPLFLFKKQFGRNTEFPYYVGTKIWNEPIHHKLKSSADVTQLIQTN